MSTHTSLCSRKYVYLIPSVWAVHVIINKVHPNARALIVMIKETDWRWSSFGRPSRGAVNSFLADTSVCPGLLLQLSVCVHLCVISSALSVPVRSLQKSLGLVIPLLATLQNICHYTVIRDPATSARVLAFVSSNTHTHTLRFLFSLLLLLLPPSFFFFTTPFFFFFSHKKLKWDSSLIKEY